MKIPYKILIGIFWLFTCQYAKGDTLTIVSAEARIDLFDKFESTRQKAGIQHSRIQQHVLDSSGNVIWSKGERPGFGFLGNDEVWYRGVIDNQTNSPVYIDVIQGFMDTVEYFLQDTIGLSSFYVSGTLMPYNTRQANSGFNPLKIPPGIWKVLIRTRARYFTNAPVWLFGEKEFFFTNDCRNLNWGLFYGLITFLTIYLLYIFIKMKDVINAYFSLWVLSVGLVSAFANGIMFKYVWPQL